MIGAVSSVDPISARRPVWRSMTMLAAASCWSLVSRRFPAAGSTRPAVWMSGSLAQR